MSTDREWEKWGRKDPYFGVITQDKFRGHNLTDETKREFFESGRNQIHHVLGVCRHHFDRDFTPTRVLDFGCGTGRLVIPFAEIAEEVVGVDVSPSMLREAGSNCQAHSIENVRLLQSDDQLSTLVGQFDLIHSSIVFQHIPVKRGRRIFTRLLDRTAPGGICAVQFTYAKTKYAASYGTPRGPFSRIVRETKKGLHFLMDSGRSGRDPEMQMNLYRVNDVLFLAQSAGIGNVHLEFSDHRGVLAFFLYGQRMNGDSHSPSGGRGR